MLHLALSQLRFQEGIRILMTTVNCLNDGYRVMEEKYNMDHGQVD